MDQQQPKLEKIEAAGAWRHKSSGMIFPEAVADFRRISIHQFLPDGSNIGVNYLLATPNAEIGVTVFSFPSPPLPQDTPEMRQQFAFRFAASIVNNMQAALPHATREQSILVHVDRNGRRYDGHQAKFALTLPEYFGRKQVAAKAETYIFSYIGVGWTLQYRFTYPADADDHAARVRFMDNLAWTHSPLN